MELDVQVIWSAILTFVILPFAWVFTYLVKEVKRQQILINKTREEIAKDYATREQIEADFQRIMDSISKIDEKLDRLQHKTYFQE